MELHTDMRMNMVPTSRISSMALFVLVVLVTLPACASNTGPATADIAPLLVQAGDLPKEMTGGTIETILPTSEHSFSWSEQPRPWQEVRQDLKGGVPPFQPDSRIAVWRFRSAREVADAYQQHSVFLSPEPAYNGIGEQSASYNNLEGTLLYHDYIARGQSIMFTRCTALVEVDLRMAVKEISADTALLTDALAAYARRLDQRLGKHVC